MNTRVSVLFSVLLLSALILFIAASGQVKNIDDLVLVQKAMEGAKYKSVQIDSDKIKFVAVKYSLEELKRARESLKIAQSQNKLQKKIRGYFIDVNDNKLVLLVDDFENVNELYNFVDKDMIKLMNSTFAA